MSAECSRARRAGEAIQALRGLGSGGLAVCGAHSAFALFLRVHPRVIGTRSRFGSSLS